jgi:phosphoglycolate phosphatase-like HAD superfamily hydrolase
MSATRKLVAVIFDLDGTLTMPVLDFKEMRRRALPKNAVNTCDILRDAAAIEDDALRESAFQVIARMEQIGIEQMTLAPHCVQVLNRIGAAGLHQAIVTRNGEAALSAFVDVVDSDRALFRDDKCLIHRDSGYEPKPSPQCVYALLDHWKVERRDSRDTVLFVGDSAHDIDTASNANVLSALVLTDVNRENTALRESATFVLHSLVDLLPLLDQEVVN